MTTPALEAAVSAAVGIVRDVETMYVPSGYPQLADVAAVPCDFARATGAPVEPRSGATGFTAESVRAAAIGETIERYAASLVPPGAIRVCPAADLDPDLRVPVADLAVYDAAQQRAGLRNVTDDEPLGWTSMVRPGDGVAAWVPAQLVYLGYHLAPGEPLLGHLTSSGLACAADPRTAALGGALEVIERDAAMLAWRLRIPLPVVDVAASPACSSFARQLAASSIEVTLLDATGLAGVPTVIAFGADRHRAEPIAHAFGAASAPTMRTACAKAFREAIQTLVICDQMRQYPALYAGAADPSGFNEHIVRYLDPDTRDLVADTIVGRDRVTVDDDQDLANDDPFAAVLERAAANGLSFGLVEVTPPDVADLGLHVVRAVSVDACWLDVAEDAPFLGRPRLARVHAGRRAAAAVDGGERLDVNPTLHPYP